MRKFNLEPKEENILEIILLIKIKNYLNSIKKILKRVMVEMILVVVILTAFANA